MGERTSRSLDDLVMEKIIGMITCGATLRSCRSVSIEWHRLFNEKAFANSVFMDLRNIVREFPDGLGYQRQTHSFDQRVTVNEVINLHVSSTNELLQDDVIVDYFVNKGNHLKYLALEDNENCSARSAVYFQFMENVLFKWCQKLETLKLIGLSQYRFDLSPQTVEKMEIPLRNLILDYGKYDYFLSSQRLMSLEGVFSFAKSLESLTYIGSLHVDCIPEKLFVLPSNDCRNLSSLELRNVTIKRRAFGVIVNAGWPLRKFIFDGKFGEDTTSRDLNAFLHSYKASLRHLDLQILWSGWYIEREVEIVVHELQELRVLKLNVDKLNVGYSGSLGHLEKLRDLEFRVCDIQFGTQYDFHTMFRNASSGSLQSLWLDEWYVEHVGQVRETFPNIKMLEVKCKVMRFAQLFCDLNIATHHCLEDLTIIANFKRADVANGNWADQLVTGLSAHRLRVFKLVNSNLDYYYCRPFINKSWMERWLSGKLNNYFRLEFVGFLIRADEISSITRMLSNNANFTKLVDCVVVDMSNIDRPKWLRLGDVEFFRDSVEDLIANTERQLTLI